MERYLFRYVENKLQQRTNKAKKILIFLTHSTHIGSVVENNV